jgi:hypothetical protein
MADGWMLQALAHMVRVLASLESKRRIRDGTTDETWSWPEHLPGGRHYVMIHGNL